MKGRDIDRHIWKRARGAAVFDTFSHSHLLIPFHNHSNRLILSYLFSLLYGSNGVKDYPNPPSLFTILRHFQPNRCKSVCFQLAGRPEGADFTNLIVFWVAQSARRHCGDEGAATGGQEEEQSVECGTTFFCLSYYLFLTFYLDWFGLIDTFHLFNHEIFIIENRLDESKRNGQDFNSPIFLSNISQFLK